MTYGATSIKQAVCLLLIVILFLSKATAQNKVHGQVVDLNGQPLLNASVLLLNANDSSLVKGYITEKDGRYLFENLEPGKYLVASSFSGLKQTYTAPFQIAGKEEIKMKE